MISFASIASDTFLLVWNISSAVTFVMPLFAFTVARLTVEQEYDENQNDEQDNNYYENNYNNPDYYDEYGNYVGPTPWWHFWARSNNGQYEEEDGSNDEQGAPWWYIWGDREGRDREEEEGNGAVLFVYLWTLLFFAGLIYLANTTRMNVSKLQALRLALFCFANYCFVAIVLLTGLENAIETEGREIEETGFYGQRAVLLLITCFFALVQSIVFVSWTTKRIKHINASAATTTDVYVNADDNDPTESPDYKVTV